MSIEKAFAIEAEPGEIWDALWSDLQKGEEGAYSLEGSSRPSRIDLMTSIGGVRCSIMYRIERKEGFSEVSATILPLSKRYGVYQALTFGHLKRNYEMLLVTGLSNLKDAVEGRGDWEEVT
jgi:hypothetical protein